MPYTNGMKRIALLRDARLMQQAAGSRRRRRHRDSPADRGREDIAAKAEHADQQKQTAAAQAAP